MIKGMTLVTPVASVAALDELASLLGALGFEPGKNWDDGTGSPTDIDSIRSCRATAAALVSHARLRRLVARRPTSAAR